MSRIGRIRKRDKNVVQTKKVVQNEIRKIAGIQQPATVGQATFYTQGGSGGGTTGDEGVLTKVFSYNVAGGPSYVTRATVKPTGAVYAYDDSANEEVQIRFSSWMDPRSHMI